MKDKQTGQLKRDEMVQRLRNLANELEAGGLKVGEVDVTLPPVFEVTQTYDEKTRKVEYSFALSWPSDPAKWENGQN